LWSVGNLMTVPIIKLCGLGVGLLLWYTTLTFNNL
jgi:hypothetical protein